MPEPHQNSDQSYERVSISPLVSVTLLEHLSSPPVFCEVRFTRSLVLCACFVDFCPLYFSIVLSVLLRLTDSDYPFGIFKLFLPTIIDSSNSVVYFVFHFITVRTVSYIFLFVLWQFELCSIFCFSFYDSSNGVEYFVFHFMTVWTVWYILFFIL